MKKLIILTTILLIFFNSVLYCQQTKEQIIKMSKQYYLSLNKFSIEVEKRFKNMIIVDTVSHSTECYIDKSSDIMIFKEKGKAYVRVSSDEYSVNVLQDFFSKTKNKNKRYSAYESEYKQLPFIETEFFFDGIRKRNDQFQIIESDTSYLLRSPLLAIAFRKFDYSISSITDLVYDRMHNGFQFSQSLFGIVKAEDSASDETIGNILAIINDPLKDISKEKREPMPESIDRSLLEKNLTQIVNGQIQIFKGKTIFLDFFYQGCLPCVKSYPYVNALFKSADSNLVVIGVDQLLRDTSTIDKYIVKYNLQYPILIGESAVFLRDYFKLHSFPAFLVINSEGRLIEFGDGFTESSFKRLTKKIL